MVRSTFSADCKMSLTLILMKKRCFSLFQKALLQLFFQNVVFALLPLVLTRLIVRRAISKISLTFSNVPGPKEKVSIAGEPIDSCMFFANHLHPVLAFVSYDREINATLLIQRRTLDSSHMIPWCFMKAIVEMCNEIKIEVPNSITEYTKKR